MPHKLFPYSCVPWQVKIVICRLQPPFQSVPERVTGALEPAVYTTLPDRNCDISGARSPVTPLPSKFKNSYRAYYTARYGQVFELKHRLLNSEAWIFLFHTRVYRDKAGSRSVFDLAGVAPRAVCLQKQRRAKSNCVSFDTSKRFDATIINIRSCLKV